MKDSLGRPATALYFEIERATTDCLLLGEVGRLFFGRERNNPIADLHSFKICSVLFRH